MEEHAEEHAEHRRNNPRDASSTAAGAPSRSPARSAIEDRPCFVPTRPRGVQPRDAARHRAEVFRSEVLHWFSPVLAFRSMAPRFGGPKLEPTTGSRGRARRRSRPGGPPREPCWDEGVTRALIARSERCHARFGSIEGPSGPERDPGHDGKCVAWIDAAADQRRRWRRCATAASAASATEAASAGSGAKFSSRSSTR